MFKSTEFSQFKTFLLQYKRFLQLFFAAHLLCLTSCMPTKQIPKPSNDVWDSEWHYQQTDWYPVLQSKLNTNTPYVNPLLKLGPLIKQYCHQAAQNTWFTEKLLPQTKTPDSETVISPTEKDGKQSVTLIDFSGGYIDDDCAGIIAYLATSNNADSLHLDFSDNQITNKGVAYLIQISDEKFANAKQILDIDLQENVGIAALGKHYATELTSKKPQIKWHLDGSTLREQQQALAYALLAEARSKLLPTSRPYIKSHASFASGNRGIKLLVALLGPHKTLQEITLSARQNSGLIDASAATALANVIEIHPELHSLTIANHPIGDGGATKILNALKANKHRINLFNLSATGISDATLLSLPSFISPNPMMLIVSNNPDIHQESIQTLSEQYPQWIILN